MTARHRTRMMVLKELGCEACGHIFLIPRRGMRNKKAGHRKKLWCFVCRKRTTHVELHNEGTKIRGRH